MFNRFNRTFINSAQRFNEVPRLTAAQEEAMRLVDTLCGSDRFRLDMDFRRGDIQFLNNRLLVHGRTDYEDRADVRDKGIRLGTELRSSTPDDVTRMMKTETARMREALRKLERDRDAVADAKATISAFNARLEARKPVGAWPTGMSWAGSSPSAPESHSPASIAMGAVRRARRIWVRTPCARW